MNEEIIKIKETGKCNLKCDECKLKSLCSTMPDTSKKEVAEIYLKN